MLLHHLLAFFRPRPETPRRPRRLALEALEDRCVPAGFFVAPMGNDAAAGTLAQPFATIGHALAVAVHAGDVVSVRAGTYHERLSLTHSGVTLQAYASEHPVLTNAGSAGGDMILLTNVSNVTVAGLEITANHGVSDGSGIRFLGAGSNITLRNNVIHAQCSPPEPRPQATGDKNDLGKPA